MAVGVFVVVLFHHQLPSVAESKSQIGPVEDDGLFRIEPCQISFVAKGESWRQLVLTEKSHLATPIVGHIVIAVAWYDDIA